ncbi:MAG: hypothetical protein AAFN40_08075 [Cyanobacteria bacterium J06560_6]
MNKAVFSGALVAFVCFGCTSQPEPEFYSEGTLVEVESITDVEVGVAAVTVAREENTKYQFAVTVKSPDEGCDRYANWWEVITEDGKLLYRRILAHSHVEEQPFTRSGGPVDVEPDEVVIVRSHMHPTGYHTQAMKGSFSAGFEPTTLPTDFADELAEVEPLPTGCAF